MGSTSFSNKVVGIFSDSSSANSALDDLNANGFDRSDISVLAREYDESETVVTHSSATAYPDTELRNDTYRSGITGSDVYPRGTMDATMRGEIAGNTVIETTNYDNRSTIEKVGDSARSIDDKLTGTDLLNNNTVYTDNRSAVELTSDALNYKDRDLLDPTYTDRNVVIDSDRVYTDSDKAFDNAHDVAEKDPKAMVKGATAGGALGLIAGLGVLLIPGIGPVLAAGPLAAAVTAAAGGAAIGATAGTLVGLLNDEGIPSDRADFYNRHFNKGNIIVMVHTDEGGAVKARQVLVKHNPETIDTF